MLGKTQPCTASAVCFVSKKAVLQVVDLRTRNEGEYMVHSTASIYSGGSVGGSPAQSHEQARNAAHTEPARYWATAVSSPE